ncbi:MAG TPA: orotidine-5'-phosphate decarboxylase [Desulfobulbaceae bacterium]|nr:orotidine-5'-phosphate decarboxylase [Desulfobulbaceae bacterium]
MKIIPLNERIIFALDFPEPELAAQWVRKLDSHLRFFKVGLQLFLAGGWPVVEDIIGRGNKVMLDLKFFDIPETVHLAVRQLQNRGVSFATIHGNRPIIEAAVADKGEMKVLAVTVLTSFDESDMVEMGFTGSVRDLVLIRARKALALGCDGVVASALEATPLRDELGKNFLVVTPGIRPGLNRDVERDDQRRVATALQAIADGADHVVIGRPISTAPDPVAAVAAIQEEIARGLSS